MRGIWLKAGVEYRVVFKGGIEEIGMLDRDTWFNADQIESLTVGPPAEAVAEDYSELWEDRQGDRSEADGCELDDYFAHGHSARVMPF
jgi:hypothetical protein